MKLESFFSLKDYFNYYISGLLWCLGFLFLAEEILLKIVKFVVTTPIETGGLLILGAIVLFVPYVVGFTFLPLGMQIIKFWQGKNRTWRPDPRIYLLMTDKNSNSESNPFEGSRISSKETQRLVSTAKQVFGFDYKEAVHLYFLPMRAYILEYGGASAAQSERRRDLQVFAQSLLLPIPLTIITFSIYHFWGSWLLFGWCIAAIILHIMLVSRYFELEASWVRNVYRAFLVITSKKES